MKDKNTEHNQNDIQCECGDPECTSGVTKNFATVDKKMKEIFDLITGTEVSLIGLFVDTTFSTNAPIRAFMKLAETRQNPDFVLALLMTLLETSSAQYPEMEKYILQYLLNKLSKETDLKLSIAEEKTETINTTKH